MGKLLKDTVLRNTGFWLLAGASMLMFLLGMFMPPPGIIDSSILYAVSELLGFAALYAIIHAVDKGLDAKFKHGNTSVTIGDLHNHNTEEVNIE